MQPDMSANLTVDQEEEDQDQNSLFGSPPPTPIRGRSPSPGLALPNASSSTQNVGTIALPGSHHCSELPVNPLALSLSYALHVPALRPPAQSQPSQGPSPHIAQIHTPSTSSPSVSRPSSAAPHPKKKASKKSVSKESTPRLPGPEFTLPDPSDQPPANFLRNQSGLLGTAGLVGGVRPATLSRRHIRGTNPTNPIVVEDEDDTPSIGRASKFRPTYRPPVDPNLLPTPPIQDVVSTLIGQKDIFPVLENLLRLIASDSPDSSLHPETSSIGAGAQRRAVSSMTLPDRPTKKRKLNRVPAGAVDWDVPYPFSPGEGPNAYRTTWERQRGKQLLSQLLGLIKTAARKAATKIYYENGDVQNAKLQARAGLQEKVKVHGHYRPVTAAYGQQSHVAPARASVAKEPCSGKGRPAVEQAPSSCPTALSYTASGTGMEQLSTPLDQLISSLIAASPDQSANATRETAFGNATSSAVASISNPSGEAFGSIDQGLYDSWMNILQTFPIPSDGFSQSAEQLEDFGQLPPSASATDPDNFRLIDFDFDFVSAVQPVSETQPNGGVDALLGNPPLVSDHVIDPTLLAMHASQPTQPNMVIGPPSLSLAPSPVSSFGSPDPATPNSANWDMSMAEVYTGTNSDGGFGGVEGPYRSGLSGQVGGGDYFDALLGGQETIQMQKGKGRDLEGLPTANVEGRANHIVNPGHAEETPRAPPTTSPSISSNPSEGSSNKKDVLRRANERRAQLKAELERVRTQLWETTIEQGVLAQLVKH